MFRSLKYLVVTIVAAVFCGFLVLGPSVISYLRTGAKSVRASVKDQIPIEFELKRAGDMIEAILPELQAQVRMIAQEEVEIAALEADIRESEKRLTSEEDQLAGLRDRMRTQFVSIQHDGRDLTREQLTKQIANRFERYKSGKMALSSKQKLLDKRNQTLDAALVALDSMRHRKIELEQKVEALAAQAKLIEASSLDSTLVGGGSELTNANRLLEQIETRLSVAKRVLEHEQDLFEIQVTDRPQDETQVLAEFDSYFGESL